MSNQIPLDLSPTPHLTFDNFTQGQSNAQALSMLRQELGAIAPVMILTGPRGTGKTHLGTAWAKQNAGLCFSGHQLSDIPDLVAWPAVIFVDDAHMATDDALFTLANWALNGQIRALLLAGAEAPRHWSIAMPDLRSRLYNAPLLALDWPGEDIIRPIIRKFFEDRGRSVTADVVSYIYTHSERSVDALRSLVKAIDMAAQAEKKDVSRNFVIGFMKAHTTD